MLEDAIQDVERELRRLLSAQERPRVLAEAMRWAVEGGGKRIRPRICLASAVAVGGASSDAILPACAVELLHSYTLVHDDLPAMDNDAERRGRPSVWAKFGEANAILAGDALQALAFAALAQVPERRPGARARGRWRCRVRREAASLRLPPRRRVPVRGRLIGRRFAVRTR